MVSYGLKKLIIEVTSQVFLIIYLITFYGFFFRKMVITTRVVRKVKNVLPYKDIY